MWYSVKFLSRRPSLIHLLLHCLIYFDALLPFTPTVIPKAPHIMQITFNNTRVAALLHWNTTESSQYLRSSIRLRTGNSGWVKPCFGQGPDVEVNGWSDLKLLCFQEAGRATEFRKGLVYVHGLTPLTDYVFQMRTCHSGRTPDPSCTNSSATTQKNLCSRWSPSVAARSPGKGKLATLRAKHDMWLMWQLETIHKPSNLSLGPSQQLLVWRIFRNLVADKLWNVTVLWKVMWHSFYEWSQTRVIIHDGRNHDCNNCWLSPPASISWRLQRRSAILQDL